MGQPRITDRDLVAVLQAGQAVGLDPHAVLVMLTFESAGFDPAADNGGCVGLNQFCPGTFAKAVPGMTAAQYKQLSAEQQLSGFVVPFWLSTLKGRPLSGAADLEWLNFFPAQWFPHAPPSHVVSSDLAVLAGNPAFVHRQGQTTITLADVGATLDAVAHGARYHALAARMDHLVVNPPAVASSGLGGLALLALAFAAWKVAS